MKRAAIYILNLLVDKSSAGLCVAELKEKLPLLVIQIPLPADFFDGFSRRTSLDFECNLTDEC
jgi:hypothetical protein